MRRHLGLVCALLAIVGFPAAPSGAAAPAPLITSLSPSIGPVTGGQTITVAGRGFTGVQKVVFQSVVAPALRVLSDTKLTVHAPRHVEGTFNVRVVTDHGSSPTQGTGNDYTFTVPIVHAVSPSAGPTGGGNTVAIEGDGIDSVTRVLFGSTSTSRLTHVDDHRITVVVPKHAAGVVHVRVAGGHGESDPVLADRYRFVGSLPTITWTAKDIPGRASRLSCATPSLCVAITNGTDVYTYHGSAFDGPTAVGIPSVTSVSCARGSSYCLLAGHGATTSPSQPDAGDQVTAYDGHTFTAPTTIDVGGTIVDVACDSAASCVAIGAHEAAVLRNGVWQAPQTIDTGTTLSSLSCPSAGFCLAADNSGATIAFDGKTWSAPQPYPYNDNPHQTDSGPYYVDCTSSDYCVLDVSSFGSAIARRHGVWGRLSSPEGSRGTGGLSCATPDFCVLVPNSEDFNLDLLFDGAKSAYTDLARPSFDGDVSCPSTATCAAAIDGRLYIGVAR